MDQTKDGNYLVSLLPCSLSGSRPVIHPFLRFTFRDVRRSLGGGIHASGEKVGHMEILADLLRGKQATETYPFGHAGFVEQGAFD